ncbi:MAG: regulator of sigma E protease [Vicingaceae bacterium]|jgi:regulator of sigma E protease
MEILIQASQLLLSLSILVVLHELGHFIPAKLFKTRVEKFYLFFDPWFSLFKVKKGETEYGIGWLPLGGYVKIAGMIDESMDKEQMKKPAEPWEFRSKPAWQRLIIMLGGVTVNIILGILIYIMVMFTWGREYMAPENMTYGVYADSSAQSFGFQSGDKVLAVGGKEVKKFSEVQINILLEDDKTVTIDRKGQKLDLAMPMETVSKMLESQRPFLQIAVQPKISTVDKGSFAEKGGMKAGDIITEIDGVKIEYWRDVIKEIQKNKTQEINLSVLRNGSTEALNIQVSEKGTIGIGVESLDKQLEFSIETYTFAQSVPEGFREAYNKFDSYLKQMKLMFTPETGAYKSMGGFITIGKAFSTTWDWERFWNFTAFLSIILAIMNILPIPALDGGHVMFLLYEIIVGKPAPEKFMEYAQIAGIVILLSLMLFANGNDILKLFN